MNIALTGSKGLIGSALKIRLEKEGHKIVMEIDKKIGKEVEDLEDQKMDPFHKVDMFIHAAAYCKIKETISNTKLAHINAVDCFNVMEFCRKNKIPRVVYFSSERVLNKERNPYTAGKLYGEELCKAYKQCYGIDYLIIRPSTVYGPFPDKTKRLVHIFVTSALKNRDLYIYGDPETKTLDFTHVEDFIEGIMLAINSNEWNKDYNISGSAEFNIHELAKFVINETNSQSQIIVDKPEIAQPQQVRTDLSAIKSLGYQPKINLLDGIRETINWYKRYLRENPGAFDNF